MAIPLWTTEGVNSTPHRARVTHANIFSRVAQGPDKGVRSQCCSFLLSFLEQSSSRALVMSHTWLDRALFLMPHSNSEQSVSTRPSEQDQTLRSTTRTYVWPVCRTKPVHRLWAERSRRGWRYGRYDCALTLEKSKHWFDLQLWRGHGHYTCCIGGGWKINFWECWLLHHC